MGEAFAANLASYYQLIGGYKSFAGTGSSCHEKFTSVDHLLSMSDYNNVVLKALGTGTPTPTPTPIACASGHGSGVDGQSADLQPNLLPATSPPTGAYCMVVTLEQYDPSCGSADGYCIAD